MNPLVRTVGLMQISLCGTEARLLGSCALLASFSTIPCNKVIWDFGVCLDCVVSWFIVIPFHDISHICAFASMAHSVVDRVYTVVFHTFIGSFCEVASRKVFEFNCHPSYTSSSLSLSINSI